MSPETRAFLDGVRHADDPTREDERRVLGAVHAAVAVGAIGGGAAGAAKATKTSALFGASGLKLGGAVVGLGALTWTLGWAVPARDAELVRAVVPSGRPANEPTPIASVLPTIPSAPRAPEKAPVRSRASNEPRPREPTPVSLREEIALLAEVQAALARGDGRAALARLDGHVTTDRQFFAERRAARVLALCSLGRDDEARLVATALLRDDPASVQRGAVERSCAATKRGDER